MDAAIAGAVEFTGWLAEYLTTGSPSDAGVVAEEAGRLSKRLAKAKVTANAGCKLRRLMADLRAAGHGDMDAAERAAMHLRGTVLPDADVLPEERRDTYFPAVECGDGVAYVSVVEGENWIPALLGQKRVATGPLVKVDADGDPVGRVKNDAKLCGFLAVWRKNNVRNGRFREKPPSMAWFCRQLNIPGRNQKNRHPLFCGQYDSLVSEYDDSVRCGSSVRPVARRNA